MVRQQVDRETSRAGEIFSREETRRVSMHQVDHLHGDRALSTGGQGWRCCLLAWETRGHGAFAVCLTYKTMIFCANVKRSFPFPRVTQVSETVSRLQGLSITASLLSTERTKKKRKNDDLVYQYYFFFMVKRKRRGAQFTIVRFHTESGTILLAEHIISDFSSPTVLHAFVLYKLSLLNLYGKASTLSKRAIYVTYSPLCLRCLSLVMYGNNIN